MGQEEPDWSGYQSSLAIVAGKGALISVEKVTEK